MSDGEIDHSCAAYGCPLAGTRSYSIHGADDYYCLYHDGLHTSDFDRVTQRIKKHVELIRFARDVSRLGPCYWTTIQHAAPDGYRLRNEETWREYTKRLDLAVDRKMWGV